MKNLIYSTNNQEATFKDSGPFKILTSDNGIKGQKTFVYQRATTTVKAGKEIKIQSKMIKTAIGKADFIQ